MKPTHNTRVGRSTQPAWCLMTIRSTGWRVLSENRVKQDLFLFNRISRFFQSFLLLVWSRIRSLLWIAGLQGRRNCQADIGDGLQKSRRICSWHSTRKFRDPVDQLQSLFTDKFPDTLGTSQEVPQATNKPSIALKKAFCFEFKRLKSLIPY